MKYDEVINKVRDDANLVDRDQAATLTIATLELLGQRLAGREPAELAAQLPEGLKEPLSTNTGAAETFDVDEFLRRLAEREGAEVTPEQARGHAQVVLATIGSFVSGEELDDVRAQLPAGYADLFA